jgi:large subunit ribosomal protein L15
MKLNKLPQLVGKRKKRVGRGYGSGRGGHTVGRGSKGQKARGKVRLGFEGGQLPLSRRLPRRGGFRSMRGKPVVINLSRLDVFAKGALISPATLVKRGLIKKVPPEGVKILGKGSVTKALKFEGVSLSAAAREKILQAGGEVVGGGVDSGKVSKQ